MQQIHAFIGGSVARRQQRPISEAESSVIWRRWHDGVLFPAIAKELGRWTPTVTYLVLRHGGIAPRDRRRAVRTIHLSEREEISRGIVTGESLRSIANRLRRAPSSISREIRRHGGLARYRAAVADTDAWENARRPKTCRLASNPRLQQLVSRKLTEDWSPEQISHWLVSEYPDDPLMRVSHETIYRTLYVQARGALKKELTAHLRKSPGYRRSRHATHIGLGRGQIVDAVPISMRPPEVEDRAVPGHWEGDMLAGTKWSNIATLVERKSRYVMLVRLPERDAHTVMKALTRRIQKLPESLKQSLTWDRGKEMAEHKAFSIATDVKVFFCDPSSPWQRGSNENTNGLLRQYFPKGMDLTNVTQRQLDVVARKLNTRPRETLGWKTPAEVLEVTVATTG